MELSNKKVLVIGMARSGIAAAKKLNEKGALVTITDLKNSNELKETIAKLESQNIKTITGYNPVNLLQSFDLVIPSPGVPLDNPLIQKAKELSKKIISEIELAYLYTKAPIIAVTGTNGKTTTTTLIGQIIKNSGKEFVVAGNIGNPFSYVVDRISKNGYIVLEISSFQLEYIDKFKPYISVILNISEDHINWHKTHNNYVNSKIKIFKNQTKNDYTLLNYEDELVRTLNNKTNAKVNYFGKKYEGNQGAFVKDDYIFINDSNGLHKICKIKDIALLGEHNLENSLAAVNVSWLLNIDKKIIAKTLIEFKGVEHRLEFVTTHEGVKYYNDSKGTNPLASIKAIKSFEEQIILIAGGIEKNSDYTEFVKSFENRVKYCILIGETAERIKKIAEENSFYNSIIVNTMEEAVKEAYMKAIAGDCVLLSPACASWDMFSDFEERGQIFKKNVKKLRGN